MNRLLSISAQSLCLKMNLLPLQAELVLQYKIKCTLHSKSKRIFTIRKYLNILFWSVLKIQN